MKTNKKVLLGLLLTFVSTLSVACGGSKKDNDSSSNVQSSPVVNSSSTGGTGVVSSSSTSGSNVVSSTITGGNSSQQSTSAGPVEVTLASIRVIGSYKATYNQGEQLDLTNAQLKLTYSDNTTENIDLTIDMLSSVDMSTAGVKEITVTYEGLTTKFYIEVVAQQVEKIDPTIEISIESGATLTIGKSSAPTATVSEGANYITYFELDGVNVGTELPTTPGTYSFIVEVQESDTYNEARVWRWFYLVEDKLTPEISFSIETGSTLTLGVDEMPTVTVTEGLDYTVQFDKDETFFSNECPTEPGTYAMVVKVTGNAEYNNRTAWVVFTLVGNNGGTPSEKKNPEIVFSYEAGTTFYIGGEEKPTATVSEGADYEFRYSSDELGYDSTEFPSEAGTYSLVVTVNENDTYNAGKAWLWFRLAEMPSTEKLNAEITFNYAAGTTYYVDGTERPTVTVSEGADYVITYESEAGYNSKEFPTVAGTYSLVVTVNENDTYNAGKAWLWFRLEASQAQAKVDPSVTFSIDAGATLTIGEDAEPTFEVTEGLKYTYQYEKDEKFFSNEFPTTPGTYALVVNVEGNDTYNSKAFWVVFTLVAPDNA